MGEEVMDGWIINFFSLCSPAESCFCSFGWFILSQRRSHDHWDGSAIHSFGSSTSPSFISSFASFGSFAPLFIPQEEAVRKKKESKQGGGAESSWLFIETLHWLNTAGGRGRGERGGGAGGGLHSNESHTSSSSLSTLSPWLLMLLIRQSSHRKLHHRGGGQEGGATEKNIERGSGQMREGGGGRERRKHHIGEW